MDVTSTSENIPISEGFLIGNAQKCIRREISDQSMYNTEEDLIVSIYSCIPCGAYMSFYDSCGNVKESVVDDFLGERKNSVVGWYRYRRNLVAFPSAREMIVHKNLRRLFPGNIFFSDEHLILGVFGSACYPTTATHTYDYAFFVQKADVFKSLAINLLNLGDTKSKYRGGSLSGSFINSSTFDSVVDIPWDFTSCWQTEDAVQQMHKMLRDKCDSLAEELAASESVNSMIEQEVQKLDAELESLTIKALEPAEPVDQEKEQDEKQENSENIPPEQLYLPFMGKHAKIMGKQAKMFGKRNLKDLIDLHEELHPLYGKYFPQNRASEPGTSSSSSYFSGEVSGINYNFLPPKKKIKVILQERRRILDHDYEGVSDDDPPQQFVPETEEADSSNTYNTCYVASDAAEGIDYKQIVDCYEVSKKISGQPSGVKAFKKPRSIIFGEPKVKVVYLDEQKNIPDLGDDANIQCPEAVVEEIVETVESEKSSVESPSSSDSESKITNIPEDHETVPNNDDNKIQPEEEQTVPSNDDNKIQPEKERTDSTSHGSSSGERGRPLVIYCKPPDQDEGASKATI
ncbi:BRISC complex subunit Abraxas 2 like protein [Argiope bruennichi]|uniref:BRISC complex subunit Abraxas 2 like protein n=1 Tax=Argiope bruennichi TaxID=94029 RepID=A0A8T0FNC5_ARGBR|nr:BRISC complex subunit Abraxas 2 like protein [Argiope bruennichi]